MVSNADGHLCRLYARIRCCMGPIWHLVDPRAKTQCPPPGYALTCTRRKALSLATGVEDPIRCGLHAALRVHDGNGVLQRHTNTTLAKVKLKVLEQFEFPLLGQAKVRA